METPDNPRAELVTVSVRVSTVLLLVVVPTGRFKVTVLAASWKTPELAAVSVSVPENEPVELLKLTFIEATADVVMLAVSWNS